MSNSELRVEQKVNQRKSFPEVIELDVDQDGSPVTLEAGSWFVLFVPGLKKQWWHRFVNKRHKHVFAMRPARPGEWTLFEPWWHRLLTATLTSEQARKFLLWGSRGDVLLVREFIPGRGSQVRGWANCAVLTSYLLGRPYWVWTPHGLYKCLLREPGVCRVDVSVLLTLEAAELAKGSRVIRACQQCAPGAPRQPGVAKPFCLNCGRDLLSLELGVFEGALKKGDSGIRTSSGEYGLVKRVWDRGSFGKASDEPLHECWPWHFRSSMLWRRALTRTA